MRPVFFSARVVFGIMSAQRVFRDIGVFLGDAKKGPRTMTEYKYPPIKRWIYIQRPYDETETAELKILLSLVPVKVRDKHRDFGTDLLEIEYDPNEIWVLLEKKRRRETRNRPRKTVADVYVFSLSHTAQETADFAGISRANYYTKKHNYTKRGVWDQYNTVDKV